MMSIFVLPLAFLALLATGELAAGPEEEGPALLAACKPEEALAKFDAMDAAA